jgi:hypothetical protein
MTTHDTTELGLRTAIAAFRVPTGATSLTGVGRIDRNDRHTRPQRFVADKRSQLAEGPIAVSCSLLWPSNPRPLTNAREVFQCNRPLCALGLGNQPLADHVVGVFLKAPLTAFQLAQAPFGRPGSDFLQRLPPIRVPLTAALNPFAAEALAVRVNCQVDDTHINSKRAVNVKQVGLVDITGGKQGELPVDQAQIRFTTSGCQQRLLALAAHKPDRLSLVHCPDRDVRTFQVPGEVPVIKGNCRRGLEGALVFAIQLVGIGDFGDAAYRQLRANLERLAHVLIDQLLQGELAKGAGCPGNGADVGAAALAASSVRLSASACSSEGISFSCAMSFTE